MYFLNIYLSAFGVGLGDNEAAEAGTTGKKNWEIEAKRLMF